MLLPQPRQLTRRYTGIAAVLGAISDRLADSNLTVAALAASQHVSASSLRTSFRSAVGCSPKQFIEHARMRKAAHLLATTRLSVKEVMAECGMSDPSAFSKKFKHAFHCSPSAYRASGKEAQLPHNLRPLWESCRFCPLIGEITNRTE